MGFTIFVLIILVIVWLFQVLLLDYFYEQTKLAELDEVIAGIEKNIDDPRLDDICGELASQYDVCIALYSAVNGKVYDRLINKEVSPTCVIHYADDNSLNSYYSKAIEAGGVYTDRYPLSHSSWRESSATDQNATDSDMQPDLPQFKNDDNMFVVAVSVKSLTDALGNEYVVFINLRFTPVRAIEQTRSVQFWYIAGVVVLATVVFAWLFSNRIARPLERMTSAAELMADGDYSADFNEDGYRETRRLAKTLNYAVDEISKTDRLQRELIANISHDLRTPLTLISGYSEMMRDIPGENTPENSQMIIDETKRLTTLVNDMLDFSKYSSGFEIPELKRFNLTESVRITMNRYNELVRLNGYHIDFESTEDIYVFADERMILQVIYNLLNNAVNYTGSDKTVTIKQVINDDKVRISITDTGIGISDQNIMQIWDRYYKIDHTHRRAVTGSGLGLSIVSRLLRVHSATYGVESAEGYGSTFWFELKISNNE